MSEKLHIEKFNKIRCYLITENKIHSAMQEIIIYGDKYTKLYSICLSAPKAILVETSPNTNIQFAKEVKYKNWYYKNIKYKDEILECIIKNEKKHSHVNIQETKEVSHTDLLFSLRILAD